MKAPTMTRSLPRSLPLSALALGTALALGGCVSNPPAPERPTTLSSAALLDQGIQFAVEDLVAQALRAPSFAPPQNALQQLLKTDAPARPLVAVNRVLEGAAGQETVATRHMDRGLLTQLIARLPGHEVAPLSPANAGQAPFVVTSTLTPTGETGATRGFLIHVSLTEVKSGFVIAHSVARVRAQGVDETPTAFFRDSPALSKDRATEGQIKTARTATGQEADHLYLSKLPVAALVAQADQGYENGQCDRALPLYQQAATQPGAQQMKALNGVYLCQVQLNQPAAAETTFGKIVGLGLATNNLSVRFLFSPGSTAYIADPKISAPYAMWLRQIAREADSVKACLTVAGHTSRTGNELYNDRLSLQRAASVQKQLETLSPNLSGRLNAMGAGFRENIVGSGTDDLRDALDRRVEFKIRPC